MDKNTLIRFWLTTETPKVQIQAAKVLFLFMCVFSNFYSILMFQQQNQQHHLEAIPKPPGQRCHCQCFCCWHHYCCICVLSIAHIPVVRHFKAQTKKTGHVPRNLWTHYIMRECVETQRWHFIRKWWDNIAKPSIGLCKMWFYDKSKYTDFLLRM